MIGLNSGLQLFVTGKFWQLSHVVVGCTFSVQSKRLVKYLPGKMVFESTEDNWGTTVYSDFINSVTELLGTLDSVQVCLVAFGDFRIRLISISLLDAICIVFLLLLGHERLCKMVAAWQESQVVAE